MTHPVTVPLQTKPSVAPRTPLFERWKRDPYRLLFPVGAILLLVGVAPWAAFATSGASYRPAFHAVVQIQSFLCAFAAGFLFTFIPRRSGTAGPNPLELCLAAGTTVGIAIAAWFDRWMLTQVLWLLLLATLGRFVLTRVKAKRLDAGLVWVPFSFAMGITGSVLLGLGPAMRWYWAHPTGKALVTQGLFTGLCLGIGRMLFPIMLHGRPPLAASPRSAFGWNAAAALLFFGSFFLEAMGSARAAWAVRAAVTGALVVVGMKALNPPTQPGLHRKLLWLSGWAIPAGYAAMALFPAQRMAGLHVLFIGGFTAMVFAVSTHVVLAHGGFGKVLDGWALELKVGVPFLVIAILARAAMAADAERLRLWAGVAVFAFIASTLAWGKLLLAGLVGRPPRPDGLEPRG